MICPDVPMPDAIARLPRDPRGFPIFFSVQQPGGKYDFKSIYGPQVRRCIAERLCGVCGEPLGYWMVFSGGPRSCTSRAFTDPPMHQECAEYASKVCPFLVRGGWDRSKTKRAEKLTEVDPEGYLGAPEATALYLTRGYRIVHGERGYPLFLADPPKRITWVGPGAEDPPKLDRTRHSRKELSGATRIGQRTGR